MSMNILNDISSVYVKEVIEPQLGKKQTPSANPSGGAKKVEKGKTGIEASAKRIRQAVYDIRYRARREGIELDKAYNQYMSHTTMSGPEKTAVKEKLGIGPGGGSVTEESEQSGSKKFQVRVTDKESSKTYVRYATREKINQLRNNPNISSVEMTQYGEPYEGEKNKGEQTARAKAGKSLDPVGKEDGDINNNGIKNDPSDKYLKNRRDVRGISIAKKEKSVKEGFSNWRQDLCEVIDTLDSPDDIQNKKTQIKENPKINNKISINPQFKESVENLGGYLVEMVELDEELIVESASIATEYFYENGLNEDGIDILIEELGIDNFIDFVFEISEEFNLNEARTLLGKKKSPQKLPKGTKPSQATKAAVEKYGTTRTLKGGPSSVIKKKTVAIKKAVEKQPETKTTPKQTKKGILNRVAGAVLKGMERHRQATTAASKLVSQTAQTATKAAKVASEFGKGIASGVSGTATAAKKVKKAVVGEENDLQEVAPPGMERTVKAMKKHKKEIDNPYALAWWMRGKGYKSHKKASGAMKEAVATTQPTQTEQKPQTQQPTTQTTKPNPAEVARQKQLVQIQKKQTMDRLAQLNKGVPVTSESTMEHECETIDELNRYEKEIGKDYKTGKSVTKGGTMGGDDTNSKVMRHMQKVMGAGRMGAGGPIQPRGKGKVPGQKPPAAGEYGSERRSPEQIVNNRRVALQQGRDNMSSRFD